MTKSEDGAEMCETLKQKEVNHRPMFGRRWTGEAKGDGMECLKRERRKREGKQKKAKNG